MRQRSSFFQKSLDAWSDFAIDSWLYALRFGLTMLAVLIGWTVVGKLDGEAWLRLGSEWRGAAGLVLAAGIVLAIALRAERILASQKKGRKPPVNGGRTKPTKRRQRRVNRKRTRK
ncbi:MAG: hypothetical protein KKG32_03235 [Alphaproteobacteria bacterium]|nr:hypothetical protein [Alphaproteobacteria bacterium]